MSRQHTGGLFFPGHYTLRAMAAAHYPLPYKRLRPCPLELSMPYEPKSLDLTRVQIPADLNNLVEQLSEITHDNWLKQRLADGWRHGQSRNDLLKAVSYTHLRAHETRHDLVCR